jgi:hypothetical protein
MDVREGCCTWNLNLGWGAKERAWSTRQTCRGSMNSDAAQALPLMCESSVPALWLLGYHLNGGGCLAVMAKP